MSQLNIHQSEGELRVECTIVRYNVKAIAGWLLFAVGVPGALLLLDAGHVTLAALGTFVAALGAALISQSRGPLRRVQRFEFGTIRVLRVSDKPVEDDQQ